MKVIFNITDRKPFVKALEEITGTKAIYMRTPTYAYTVDYFTVTREGNLTCNDMADNVEIERVLEALGQRGFHYESTQYDEPQPEIDCEESLEDCPPAYGVPEESGQDENVGCGCPVDTSCKARSTDRADRRDLTVAMPRETFTDAALENLQRLVEVKAALIKKALAVESLPIEVTEERVSFPWFAEVEGDSAQAYSHFITALCDMARNQKRVTAKEKDADNEKYAFRCFLLRLGFIGEEYKADRKILLKNLSGSSAFKGGAKHEVSE